MTGMVSNLAALLSSLLHPFMPEVSRQIRQQCNIDKLILLPKSFGQLLEPGHRIGEVKLKWNAEISFEIGAFT